MSCHGPEVDRVSAGLADGLLCRVALEAMHTGHFTLGIFDGCGIPSMLSDRASFIEICPRQWWLCRRSTRSRSKVADVDARRVFIGNPLPDPIESGRPVLPCMIP